MKIHLATWFEEPAQAVALTAVGNFNRLLSYYFLRGHSLELLDRYHKTGKLDEDISRKHSSRK